MVLASALLVSCVGSTTATTTLDLADVAFPEPTTTVEQVEILASNDGALLLAWTSPGDGGRDVWLSVIDEGEFSAPVLVSDLPSTELVMDEMRPALAIGPGGRVAVAWATQDWDIQVAISDDGGATFAPSLRMNGDQGEAIQVLPVVAFDEEGALHAVWLDPRDAPPLAEEPADVYHAVVRDGVATEQNLTALQESSVCGCCRPHLQVTDGRVVVTFRNTTAEGYRDPFQVSGTADGEFRQPSPSSPPTWQIDACPIAGPVGFGEDVIWLDGSQGHARILGSGGVETTPQVVVESEGEVRVTAGPREVTGWERAAALVPATPSSRLYQLEDDAWVEILGDLPDWAAGAAVHRGRLVVVGTHRGELMHEIKSLPG